MDLHVIFCNLYDGHVYQAYLNALFVSKKYNGAIITHSEYINKKLEYNESFLQAFEMDKISEEEKLRIPQYGIDKSFFDDLNKKYDAKTDVLTHLYMERDYVLEHFLDNIVQKLGYTNLERFYVFGETYKSVNEIAKKYNIAVINYEFSTMRKMSEYSCDLLHAYTCGNLYFQDELKKRYECFSKQKSKLNMFSRKELIALFVPEGQIKLLPLLDAQAEYEIGILEGYQQTSVFAGRSQITDDDIREKCERIFCKDLIVKRRHPASLSAFDLETGMQSRDTLPFILSCKRVVAISSNGLFEAMLWNRVACVVKNISSFSFACEHKLDSTKIVEEDFLNFYLFCGLVPTLKELFHPQYWHNRSQMSESELFDYNREIIFLTLGIDREKFDRASKDERLKMIFEARGIETKKYVQCYDNLKKQIVDYKVDYGQIQSELVYKVEGEEVHLECVNCKTSDGRTVSFFDIDTRINEFDFIPTKEKAGFLTIHDIIVNNNDTIYKETAEKLFITKNHVSHFAIKELTYVKNITIIWSFNDISIANIIEMNATQHKLKTEVESIRNSLSWKLTRPLRLIRKIF